MHWCLTESSLLPSLYSVHLLDKSIKCWIPVGKDDILFVFQSTKSGWFSGWFKSKPNDVQKQGSEDASLAPEVKVN